MFQEQEKPDRIRQLKELFRRCFPLQSRRRRILHFIIVPIIVLFLGYVFFDDILMPLITRHGREFSLPEVVGYKLEDAREILKMTDLDLEVSLEKYHPDKEGGTVLSQYPAPGTKVKAGRIVKVVVSVGEKKVMVPPLAGISVRQAKFNIEAAGLLLGEITWTFSDSLPPKVVVFSYPASGTEVKMGSEINLMVNQGSLRGIVYMPRLVGRTLDEAVTILDHAGLKVGLIRHVRNEEYIPETVLEQSVEEATELEIGEEIDLIVSTTD